MDFEAVIGLEIHAEMETRAKMFCSCPVVDVTVAAPNSAVCPICAGMPGTLPVVNQRAVEFAIRVALALNCTVAGTSIFARKNYFYPDLPKGYQITQYEEPLAEHGFLDIPLEGGTKRIRIRRVHLEEDTGKSTHHVRSANEQPDASADEMQSGQPYSLIDLNRAGIPLLEIVTEPDLNSPQELGIFGRDLRRILRYLEVNSGDMEKGVLRVEPNISVRPVGETRLGTRTEVKNLNSFRALERASEFEIKRQIALIQNGGTVIQETVGWDEARQVTVAQRSKEEAHDYRYFPEPDLPPLITPTSWVAALRAELPELPQARAQRFHEALGLRVYDAEVLVTEKAVADYFEQTLAAGADPKLTANWISGPLFGLLNEASQSIETLQVSPTAFAELLAMLAANTINKNTAQKVLAEMFETGQRAEAIVEARGLKQVSDTGAIDAIVAKVLETNPQAVAEFIQGKDAIANWLFGQVMRAGAGKVNPGLVRNALETQLAALKEAA
jgi:aspartyl-tRNA(Asn)/glutamyl-tRNA(Gln) amidotransferase subunit B